MSGRKEEGTASLFPLGKQDSLNFTHPEKFPANQTLFWTIPCIQDFYDRAFLQSKKYLL